MRAKVAVGRGKELDWQVTMFRKEGTMSIDPHRPLQDIATEVPGSISVLDRLGIDYCHRNLESLDAVCRNLGLATDHVLTLLEEGCQVAGAPGEFELWAARPLAALTSQIVNQHHVFTRRQLARLDELSGRILSSGIRRPEWKLLHSLVNALDRKLTSHLDFEEQEVFPHIEALESSAKRALPPGAPGIQTVQRPVRMMMLEHDSVREMMKRLRGITSNFQAPAGALPEWRELYEGLRAVDQDIQLHFFLESNILFPRAVALESSRLANGAKRKTE